ncbi:M48 family metallopeptidase [Paracoccus spongiarum]|uniref:M48 family metallopeptidase n=1 Tax=Paracoccus spongiarum TaxID=3064387 RepID=A0ABT9JCZ8_9RHOB|nr:M48 family metallopeptidase [Paracoccus sp. 2205BS29-5]MDP5307708.1 M48 family metallopeptidase [Paracoccus sp. 2205BS29-5]
MSRGTTTRQARAALLCGFLGLGACAPVAVQPLPEQPYGPAPTPMPVIRNDGSPESTARTFVSVMARMEPAVERECLQRRTQPINCDFMFVVDDRPGLEPNAFQTIDDRGRPIIGLTLSLIAATRNADEIAFVVGHEASHHVLNHLDRKAGAAAAGAVILGSIASVYGADSSAIETAQQIGASVGSRYYSRDWELQADYLGAIMTLNAGFDPENGARFFERIPDPGDHMLGTHPPRAARLAQVSRAVTDVRNGRFR